VQSVAARFHLARKYSILFGGTLLFAYLYVRPTIRRRLGSASRGYLNYSTLYALWLVAAVAYHLPSLDRLGVDVRADLTVLLAAFAASLAVVGGGAAAAGAGAALRALPPRPRAAGAAPVTAAVLSAWNLALACSTYYSFCGNADAAGAGPAGGAPDPVRAAVCGRWLRPLPAARHPAYARWVLYGEAPVGAGGAAGPPCAGSATATAAACAAAAPGAAISPVLTMWFTLAAVMAASWAASAAADAAVAGALSAEARRGLRAAARRERRRRSSALPPGASCASLASASGSCGSLASPGGVTGASLASGLNRLLRSVGSVGALWPPTSPAARGALSSAFAAERAATGGDAVGLPVAADAPRPVQVPMFPWYSGTSADLLKTTVDLMVSVKVFLGRFDARALQAAGAPAAPAGAGGGPAPADGDGVCFEYLAAAGGAAAGAAAAAAGEAGCVVDFVADTGDGFDPTYAVARCLAAPRVEVVVSPAQAAAGGAPPSAAGPRSLPRGAALVHGGDLAYPAPSDETYGARLLAPYEAALPPPPGSAPRALVVRKPALPPACWEAAAAAAGPCAHAAAAAAAGDAGAAGPAGRCRACLRAGALGAHDGPAAFILPGNHDHLDGLDAFMRHFLHRGWLGGWALPQERSYFALRLPHGWCVLSETVLNAPLSRPPPHVFLFRCDSASPPLFSHFSHSERPTARLAGGSSRSTRASPTTSTSRSTATLPPSPRSAWRRATPRSWSRTARAGSPTGSGGTRPGRTCVSCCAGRSRGAAACASRATSTSRCATRGSPAAEAAEKKTA
jgi:hypothetical protein